MQDNLRRLFSTYSALVGSPSECSHFPLQVPKQNVKFAKNESAQYTVGKYKNTRILWNPNGADNGHENGRLFMRA